MENEKIVDYLVVLNKPGRKYTSESDTRWGGLIEPNPPENKNKTEKGLKVALFGSWDFGYLVLETLKKFENKYPDKLNLLEGLYLKDLPPYHAGCKCELKI